MHQVPAERAVDPLTVEVLRAVDSVVTRNGARCFLLGATARDLLLWNVHGQSIERATRDIDLAVTVKDWASFESIRRQLEHSGHFRLANESHRVFYSRAPEVAGGYPVDILPFGGVENPAGQFAWPPDDKTIMSVIGFEEALRAAVPVQIADGLTIPIASVPSLVALKFIAWSDRDNDQGKQKDAQDLALLLRTYDRLGSLDRLYGEEAPLLEQVGFDLCLAGARLLGKDVGRFFSARTVSQLLRMLTDANLKGRLVIHMLPSLRHDADPEALAESLLQQFAGGLAISSL
jgi:predicted nucleotidyltransferase